MRTEVEIGICPFLEGAIVPQFKSDLAAGADIHAWLLQTCGDCCCDALMPIDIIIQPGERVIVRTGLNLVIPEGFEVQLRPRSGLAAKYGITMVNSPGTIDADYDGPGEDFEIKAIILNTGDKPFVVAHGDRIGQMVVVELPKVTIRTLEPSSWDRKQSTRTGGLGSTGV